MLEAWANLKHLEVEAPAGTLGISFITDDQGRPMVDTLSATSPLRGLVGLKWRLLEVDGVAFHKVDDPKEVTKVLLDKFNQPRKLKFDAGEPKGPVNKLQLFFWIALALICLYIGSGYARNHGWFGYTSHKYVAKLEADMMEAAINSGDIVVPEGSVP